MNNSKSLMQMPNSQFQPMQSMFSQSLPNQQQQLQQYQNPELSIAPNTFPYNNKNNQMLIPSPVNAVQQQQLQQQQQFPMNNNNTTMPSSFAIPSTPTIVLLSLL